jgi:hypothetical protein
MQPIGPASRDQGEGVFIQLPGTLVEVPKLGTLGNSYGPRLYPEIPDYDIPLVPDVGPMYVNIPDFPVSSLKGSSGTGIGSAGTPPPGVRAPPRRRTGKP